MKRIMAAAAVTAVLAGCGAVDVVQGPQQQVCAALAQAQKQVRKAANSNAKAAKKQLKQTRRELKASDGVDQPVAEGINAQIESALGSLQDAANPKQVRRAIDAASASLDSLAESAGC